MTGESREETTMPGSVRPEAVGEDRERLTRAAWVAAGRADLVAGGVGAVKIDRIAGRLGVTRGSFYWHFESREAFLDALVADWQATNTGCFHDAVAPHEGDPAMQLVRYCRVWLDPSGFDPAYDAAMRDWARSDPTVDRLVRAADDDRILLLNGIFRALAYAEPEAELRARVIYFHQVGYYALELKEDMAFREERFPTYFRILAGFPLAPALNERARAAALSSPRSGMILR